SLGFHMVFAALGIGLPLLMLVAEGLWLRRGRQVYLDLARKWARATGILFAIGAVSGTALSFELGLLWPPFLRFAGPLIGPACSMATAFLVAAVYAWRTLRGRRDAYHTTGLALAMVLGVLTALAQPVSGDFAARLVARTQPIKLAAMESQFTTERGAPLRIGG